RCISYLTIELKDEIIPGEFHDKMEGWMFGCDICQEVCPWNRFSKPHRQPRFHPDESVMHMDRNDWMEMTDEVMLALIKNSPLSRPGPSGIRRNLL
ncbi:MAG TPA: tRNA epoxyqueuosine(34) reductase QueG, partial [Bacteroidetes bacterium]|nr:tRNA epoxyqueuosine(34) reductase QueG [Bacteroidota bacterium]